MMRQSQTSSAIHCSHNMILLIMCILILLPALLIFILPDAIGSLLFYIKRMISYQNGFEKNMIHLDLMQKQLMQS